MLITFRNQENVYIQFAQNNKFAKVVKTKINVLYFANRIGLLSIYNGYCVTGRFSYLYLYVTICIKASFSIYVVNKLDTVT